MSAALPTWLALTAQAAAATESGEQVPGLFSIAAPLVFSVLTFLLLGLAVAWYAWRKGRRGQTEAPAGRSHFVPSRLTVRGTHGEVLRARIKVDGPTALAFTTYTEDAWWLATPTSGMSGQELELVFYTEYAPRLKRNYVTLRLFPAALNAPGDELRIELVLKLPRHQAVDAPRP